MKKIVIIIFFLVIVIQNVTASQIDDLKFAVGLYSDKNYKLAQVELKKYIDTYPQSDLISDVKYLLANVYLIRKDYTSAKKMFLEVSEININPAVRADIVLGLGQCYFFLNEYDKAEEIFKKFLSVFPHHSLYWKANFFMGRICYQKDLYDKALGYFKKAKKESSDISIDVAMLEVYIASSDDVNAEKQIKHILTREKNEQVNRALLLFQSSNLEKGEYDKIFAVGLENIPKNSQYYDDYSLVLAIAYYNTSEYDNSLKKLKKLSSEKARYYKALCFFETGKTKDAKEILEELSKSVNSEIRSNSFFYIAKMEKNKQTSIEKLQKFINDNPQHNFVPTARYLTGYNFFLLEEYEKAIENFNKALTSFQLSSNPKTKENFRTIEEKNNYLTAESCFLLKKNEKALDKYTGFISAFPKSKFADETFFKIGLIHFEDNKFPEASGVFENIIKNYPQSEKIGMSNYYLGEISLFQSEYSQALLYYKEALKGRSDQGYTWERISQIYYQNKEYSQALKTIDNIPEDNKYLFKKFLLKGNIFFATKKYEKALKAFISAEKYAVSSTNREITLSRKAWTLYQLKRFDEASKIYGKLSISAESPDKYILKAAIAAFSAEDYLEAINFFKQYVINFPDKKDFNSSLLGIADSYYNIGDYHNALIYYKKLIKPDIDGKIVNNALNGLRWVSEQTDNVEFLDEIAQLLLLCDSANFRVKLLDRKVYYEFKQELWDETISTCKEIEILMPDYNKLDEIKLIQALSYVQIKEYDNADAVYSELYSKKSDSEILLNWSKLDLLRNKPDKAITKLRKASMISRRSEIWLRLLGLELENKNKYFRNDYEKFMEFAKGENKQKAELYLIEWQISGRETGKFQIKLKELLKSKHKYVKAKAQYLKGYSLYKQDKFDEAIPELLRVRYLYPELIEIRNRAEEVACIAYIESGRLEEADQLFEVIKDNISKEMHSKISQMFKEGSEK
ncbi:MAG: tetratricopeptide repeat protein [Candidatus Cloacimonetes bacterium]|nr:tetratricopeptide repeat protein [Candidatus Cloacimonadota bacterium]